MPFTSNHSVRYVHPGGDDHNDGHTWSSAKKSVLSAFDALPPQGGTIYFANGSQIAPDGDPPQGLWFCGPDVPFPGPGWRLHKNLLLSGVGGNTHGSPSILPAADLVGFDPNAPLIWIVNTEHPMRFENIAAGELLRGIVLGDRNDSSRGVAHTTFFNVQILVGRRADSGPCVQIGRTCFWLWFDHCSFNGASGAPWDSDQRPAMLVDGGGLIFIQDCLFNGGGLKYYTGDMGWSFVLKNSTFEVNLDAATYSRHPIHIINNHEGGFGYIQNADFADWPVTAPNLPTIKIEGGHSDDVVIANAYPGVIEGPATVLSRLSQIYQVLERTPASQGQVGFWKGRVSAQHDSARRSFAPVAARFLNIAKQNAAEWTTLPFPYGPIQLEVVPTPVSMPDGTQQIGRVRFVSDGAHGDLGYVRLAVVRGPFTASRSYPAYVVAGVWVREVHHPIAAAHRSAISVFLAETDATLVDGSRDEHASPPIRGDGEWEWVTLLTKILATTDPREGWFYLDLRCDGEGHVRDFYAPMCLVIPEDQISPNEAAEIAQHLSSWPDTAPPGVISTLRGQKLVALGGLGVGNSSAMTSADSEMFQPGNIVRKVEIFDANGVSLGFVPVYKE